MTDEYDNERRLSIVDELTPHAVDDEPMPEADAPTLRIVDELTAFEVDDEPVPADDVPPDEVPVEDVPADDVPADDVLVIVSEEQLLSALREPGISADDDDAAEPADDDAPVRADALVGEIASMGEDAAADDDEPAGEDEPPSPDLQDGERPARARRPQWERPTRIAVAALALIAILFLFVFPTRSYLGQQRQVRTDRRSVAVLQAQNKDMAREVAELQTKSEIERMARVQLNMVLPGEQPYSVITPHK